MKRLTILVIGALISGSILVGCSNETADSPKVKDRDRVEDSSSEESGSEVEKSKGDKGQNISGEIAEKPVKVYVPNENATSLVEVEVEPEPGIEQTREEVVLEGLKRTETGNEEYSKAIGEHIVVNGVTVEGNMAIVDLSGENLMGSGVEESFLIDSVVMSLTSLEGIESVQFLVDGQKRDSLMGHFEIGFPLTSEDVGNNILD